MRRLTLIFLFVTIYSAPMSFDDFRIGQRGDEYRVWVYLKDKTGSEPIGLIEKTLLRRERNGLGESPLWLDLSLSLIHI